MQAYINPLYNLLYMDNDKQSIMYKNLHTAQTLLTVKEKLISSCYFPHTYANNICQSQRQFISILINIFYHDILKIAYGGTFIRLSKFN
jgi:hypothetical protein